MEYFIDALKNYAVFSGRATRKQFWMYMLVYTIIAIVLGVIDGILGMPVLGMILALALFVPSISIGARRLHDTDRSGWWQLIGIIPLIGFIVLIVFWCQDSKPDNIFGENPKG